MGGHQSRQTADATTNVITSQTIKSVKNCMAFADASNKIVIDGNANTFRNVTQDLHLRVDSDCVQDAIQKGNLATQIANSVSQSIKDESIAVLSAMDGSKASSESVINNTVNSNQFVSNQASCLNKINASNAFIIHGNSNDVDSVKQTLTSDAIFKCSQLSDQSAASIAAITNQQNQQETSIQKNQMDFIGDALKGLAGSLMAGAAVLMIVLLCFVFVFKSMGGSSAAGAAAPAAPAAALGAPAWATAGLGALSKVA